MPQRRANSVRVEIQMPPELAAAIDAASHPTPRNVWVLRTLAKAVGLKLRQDQAAPRRGRPRKPAPE